MEIFYRIIENRKFVISSPGGIDHFGILILNPEDMDPGQNPIPRYPRYGTLPVDRVYADVELINVNKEKLNSELWL